MSELKPIKNTRIKVLVLLVLFIAPAAIFYFLIYAGVHKVNRLKFYGPKTVTYKKVRGAEVADTTYHEIPAFKLTNIAGSEPMPYNSTNLREKIYLAHFMNRDMMKDMPKEITYAVSEILPEFPDLIWVTFWENADTANITYTLPSERTRKLKGTDNRWIELKGNDSIISRLKTNGYFARDSADASFDPSSVVLIDKEGRIRSYFNPVMQGEIANIKKEILLLHKEYELAYKTHRFIQFNDEENIRRGNTGDADSVRK